MESNILLIIVAFLLIVTVVGIAGYLYLRQEQNKVIPKDIYNQARTESYTEKKHRSSNPRMSSLVTSRLVLLYSTFVVVATLTALVISIMHGSSVLENLQLVLLYTLGSPVILLIFPIGITAFFVPEAVFSRNMEGIFVGYFLYLMICSLGIFVKDRRVFTIIYLIFITLLIMNVVGCSRICINPDGCAKTHAVQLLS